MAAEKPKVLCIAPFNNPHIVPIYDALAALDPIDTARASLRPLSEARVKMGWTEMSDDAAYLQPWRRRADKYRYWQELLRSDVVIFPGYFHFRTLPLHHWLRRFTGKHTFAWSEPMKHHPRTLSKSRLRRWIERMLLLPCNSTKNCFLAMGAGAEDDYRELGMTKWEYRQFLFSIDPVSTCEVPPEQDKQCMKLVYCGALNERKGVDLLIGALSSEQLKETSFHLTLLGDGPLRPLLEEHCLSAGIQDKVEFVGNRPRSECLQLLPKFDTLVLPSRFDGWGAVINEAMEAGLAIVTSDHVGARRPLVKEGQNGLIFRSGSINSLEAALKKLIGDSALVLSMRKRSQELIQEYRPAKIAAALAELCLAKVNKLDYQGQDQVLKRV